MTAGPRNAEVSTVRALGGGIRTRNLLIRQLSELALIRNESVP